jgi:acylphosphatase
MLTRRRVYYSGAVQGVGFRYTARSLARRHIVTGLVRNLPDGRVELIVEGEEGEVLALLAGVEDAMAGYIARADAHLEAPTGEFAAFGIAL